jgi:hypothetical protein
MRLFQSHGQNREFGRLTQVKSSFFFYFLYISLSRLMTRFMGLTD